MSVDNPFYHRGAIRRAEEFYGRRSDLGQILGLLRNGQSVSLIGPRRIGKSSMLLHLGRSAVRSEYGLQPPNALFIPIDCQEFGGSPPEEIYEALTTGLLDAAESAGIDLSHAERPGTYRSLDRSLNMVYNAGASVVLLLDEFELLAANEHLTPYFFARLRGLTTKYGLAYLTASQRPLFDITADEQILSSPFFNIFVTLSLGLFTSAEARGLIEDRLAATSVQFNDELIAHLLFLVGPHPFFLHIAGYHAFQAALRVGAGVSDLNRLDAPIEIEADSHLGYLWHNLTPDEQHALAVGDGPIDSLRLLEQQCLLANVDGEYRYTSEILRRFIRRQDVEGLIQAGPFVIDPLRHQTRVNGQDVSLTTSQFDLLACMSRQYGQVVPGNELETAVWGDALVDDPDRLKTLIKRLRRAIEPYGSWVLSERGVGYSLRPPD